MRFSRNVIIWSVVLYLILLLPISLFHELGHTSVCAANGIRYKIWLDGRGGHTVCFGNPRNGLAYNTMGGIFGVIASIAILIVWMFAKRFYPILVVGLAYMIDQFVKIILEGYYTPIYISGMLDGYITAIQIISWLGLMLYFAQIKKPATVVNS